MKQFILYTATFLLITQAEARLPWGPPSNCPRPKVDCCPKPKCCPPEPQCCPPAPKCCPPVCFERGEVNSECCISSGFAEPANLELRCGADLFVTAKFTYWEVMQDGMDLALPGQTSSIGAPPVSAVSGQKVLYQDQSFKPGFMVGLGWSINSDWTLYGEYTWVRGKTRTSADAPQPSITTINGTPESVGVWIPSSWLQIDPITSTTSISSKWKYGIDIADLRVGRPSYVGTHFVLTPGLGLRGMWLRQQLKMQANILSVAGAPSVTATLQSHSWAVGPRAGLRASWLFGYGFKLVGTSNLSLLYTSYDVSDKVSQPLNLNIKIDDYNTLRPAFDTSLGFAWGSYFGCRSVHLNTGIYYNFMVFWQQNMMRYMADLTPTFSGNIGNLYIQGLTVKAELAF